MHIGIDASCWLNKRGYGRHGRALLNTLVGLDTRNDYSFVIDAPLDLNTIPPQASIVRVDAAAPTAVAAAANGHRSVYDMWRMSRALSRPEYDLLLFPTIYSYVPVLSRARKIVMIHDIIAETYPDLTLPSRTAQLFWKTKVALGRRQADVVVTVSDYSRQGIIEHFGMDPDRVFVVGEASDSVFRVLDQPQIPASLVALGLGVTPERLVIYVGGFGPHKNLSTLIDVFARAAARPEFSDARLVMVGEYNKEIFHSYYDTIKNQIERLGIADRVTFTGFLSDEDLVVLLNIATVLVLPSLMEGFGLPAVEAVACGCPVIATTASPLPRLLKEGGLYVDPNQPQEMEQALVRVLGSEYVRQQMRQAGLSAAKELTWEAAAHQMLALIEKVAAE